MCRGTAVMPPLCYVCVLKMNRRMQGSQKFYCFVVASGINYI
jgi:hypothetical protein